ncbi:hypothetical protein [Photobacterium atrarenae]|uniref:MarR family transcriptional regulator n=1 Tax=Photobacterium atrarenae TaxID=865757 RepID=A0ABY5GPH6_9GAMM|nr:hypothetical protein [Photobacterium atrarenae]UTV30193.1 hypothetical protein NNL38_16540 [Photobacterium atrarenae]
MTKRELGWLFICQFGREGFTGNQLMAATEMNSTSAREFMRFLIKHNRIKKVMESDDIVSHVFILADDSPLPQRKKVMKTKKFERPGVHQRLWNTCRIMKVFNLFDLQSTASAGRTTAEHFLRYLVRARIVRKLNNPDVDTYRLNIDLGPKCPEVLEDGVHCPNREQFFPFKEES